MRLRRRRRFVPLPLPVILFLVLLAGLVGLELNLRPTLEAISRAEVDILTTEVISRVIREQVAPHVKYRDLVISNRDYQGNIRLLEYDMAEINRVAADATLAIQAELKRMEGYQIEIPLGQALGSKLFAHTGPIFRVMVSPIGSVLVSVKDRFEEAGINQTRHVVYLQAETDVRMVIPLMEAKTHVVTEVPLSEVIIVGDVPQGVFWYPGGGTPQGLPAPGR